MSQVIIYSYKNFVAVVHPAFDSDINDVIKNDVPLNSPYKIVDFNSLPSQEFRDAWELDFNKEPFIKVNFTKAIELTKNRLRNERKPLLEKLDVDFQRALESNASTDLIVAEKQRLRDITNLADTATTLQELLAIKV